jgi:AraC-like DNA-binding protein
MLPTPPVDHFDPLEDKAFAFPVCQQRTHPHLALRWGGREVLPGEMPCIEHRNFPWAFIKYTVRGHGLIRFEGQTLRLEPGMIFWSRPEAWSRLEPVGEEPLVNYVLILLGREVEALFTRFLHAQTGATHLARPQDVEAILREIIVEGLGASDHREENCAHLVEVLLRRTDTNMSSPMKPKKLARKTYWECKTYIETHYERITELGQVATACGVTVPYICRLFDQFDTVRAYEYLSSLRMSKAERLLTHTQMPIKDVAAAVGYKDLQLFSRNFRLHYHKSATQYRRQHA